MIIELVFCHGDYVNKLLIYQYVTVTNWRHFDEFEAEYSLTLHKRLEVNNIKYYKYYINLFV